MRAQTATHRLGLGVCSLLGLAATGSTARAAGPTPRAPRSYILVLASVMFLSTAPAFGQQTVHAETTVTNIVSSNFTFGPVSSSPPACDATNGGSGCKFLFFDFKGNCETRGEGRH